jgi:hypothetical protein
MNTPIVRRSIMCAATVACVALALVGVSPLRAEYPQAEEAYPGHGYSWENNSLGMEEVVPPPWTPLRHEGAAVECWGRRYEFGSGALPVQITSQGRQLFAAPPAIVWRVNGQNITTDGGGSASPGLAAAHKSVRTWESMAGRHHISVTTSLEYDGFLHVRLRLVPEGSAWIDGLSLTFALPRDQAILLNRFEEYDFEAQHVNHDNVLSSACHVGGLIAMGFTPSLWLGNHQVGMEWSCESNAGWSPMNSPDAIRIATGGERITLEIGMITRPMRVDAAFEVDFALLPTPVKPRPADWRRWRLTTALGDTAGYAQEDRVFGFAMGLPVKYRGLPLMVPRSTESLRDVARQRAQAEKNHAGFIPYGSLYGMPALLPEGEWQNYAAPWRVSLKGGSVANVNWGNSLGLPKGAESLIYVCPSQHSFQDFLVWQYAHAVTQEHISGCYFDVSSPNYTCGSAGHQHAGMHEEGWQYFPLFSQRRLMQRLYTACRARDPGFLITQHCAMQAVVSSSFTDVVIKGEALNRTFKQKGFTPAAAAKDPALYAPDYGVLPPDYFEVNYAPQQGPVLMLLPQVIKWNDELMRGDDARRTKFTRRMLVRTAVMDVPVMRCHSDSELCRAVERAQVRSGMAGDAEFHGPWESTKFLSSGGRSLQVGLYFKAEDHSLAMVIGNTTNAPVHEDIRLNLATLEAAGVKPGPKATVINAFTGAEMPDNGEASISLDLQPDELRMVMWE